MRPDSWIYMWLLYIQCIEYLQLISIMRRYDDTQRYYCNYTLHVKSFFLYWWNETCTSILSLVVKYNSYIVLHAIIQSPARPTHPHSPCHPFIWIPGHRGYWETRISTKQPKLQPHSRTFVYSSFRPKLISLSTSEKKFASTERSPGKTRTINSPPSNPRRSNGNHPNNANTKFTSPVAVLGIHV